MKIILFSYPYLLSQLSITLSHQSALYFFSVPLKINNIYYKIQQTDNSNIPQNMRTIGGIYGENFLKNWTWHLRFGLCIKLK